MENEKRLMDVNTFRKQLIVRQITTAFFNIEQRNEIGCVIELLDKQPTIDAVEVVRCKDCIYYEIGKDYLPYCNHADGGIANYPQENDFCSYGERKDDV